MPDCEMCGNNSDKGEQPFERNSTICSECKIKIITVFPKLEDEYF